MVPVMLIGRRHFFKLSAQFVAGCALALKLRTETIAAPLPEEDRNAPNPDFQTVAVPAITYFLFDNGWKVVAGGEQITSLEGLQCIATTRPMFEGETIPILLKRP